MEWLGNEIDRLKGAWPVVTVAFLDLVSFLVLLPAGCPDHFGFQFGGSTRLRQVILVT